MSLWERTRLPLQATVLRMLNLPRRGAGADGGSLLQQLGAQGCVKGSSRQEQELWFWLAFAVWDHQGNMGNSEKRVLSICVSISSVICPAETGSGPAARMQLLVPVGCRSWSSGSAACGQELRLQGLRAQPPGMPRSIRSLSNFQSISYIEGHFQKTSL